MAEAVLRRWRREWKVGNPILRNGETGQEINTGRIKIGNGRTRWLDLPWVGGSGPSSATAPAASPPAPVVVIEQTIIQQTEPTMLEHIGDLTPHPVYDDIPSLVLFYQNAKV